jgi:hypothetical protein
LGGFIMGMSVEEFIECMENCYCNGQIINITEETDYGSLSFNTDRLQVCDMGEYIDCEDDNDIMLKIQTDKILEISKQPNDINEEVILKLAAVTITFYIMSKGSLI